MLIRVTVKDAGRKIDMIKLVRTMTTLGLKEAKELVERDMANVGDTFLVNVTNPADAFKTLTTFTTWGGGPQDWANLITIEPVTESPIKLTI